MRRALHQLVPSGLGLWLIGALICGFVVWMWLPPTHPGSGKPVLPLITRNLREIEHAKEKWASEHGASNGAAVSQQDLAPYLTPRPSVAGEVYRHNVVGSPAEARLERPLGTRFPTGTVVRWSANAGCEIRLPNEQGRANGWQPLSSVTNAIPSAAATPPSP